MKKNSQKSSRVSPKQKRILSIFAVVIGIPLMLWGSAELNYQMHVKKLSNVVDKFGQDSLKPVGGVIEAGPGADSDCRHWLDTLKPDIGPCPGVGADWFVPVAQGQEGAFIANALSKAGYMVNIDPQSEYEPDYPLRGGYGAKQGFTIGLSLNPFGSQKPPYAAPTGTRWLQLFLSINDAKTQ